jgi:para-aminobenzoate synthetase component I
VKLSEVAVLPSFALLGPGFAGGGYVLVAPLVAAGGSAARVVYASYEARGDAAQCFAGTATRAAALDVDVAAVPITPQLAAEGHTAAVEAIRAAIARGDVYQVNLTLRARLLFAALPHPRRAAGTSVTPPDGDAGAVLCAALLQRDVPRFFAWVRLPDGTEFVSASPELLFAMRDGVVRCEPMKGTARPEHASELVASDKDRAELAMITDLVRNDLTPVCVPKSVRVTCERRTISLAYAQQTVSDVEGQLLPGRGPLDVLAALHPGGSVTGAPKHAAMAHIRALESTPRGPYCGALGFLERDAATFGLNIRTAWRRPDGWVYGVGGGIVWDSDPERELEEVHLKLGALR